MVHHIPSSPLSQQSKSKEKPQLWKMTCLRPAPPSRSSLNQNEATPGSSNKRNSISAKPSARKGNSTNYLTEPTLFTGKSLSEALIFASTNPQYDDRLFIELQVQYMKISSSNLGRTCCVQKLFLTFRTIFVHNMF